MVILLIVCITLLVGCSAHFYHKFVEEKKKTQIETLLRKEIEEKYTHLLSTQIPIKDIEFLEFTVDMYIKYAKDLNIYSAEQHEFIVQELERIRIQHLTKL
jgi:hypothetical protein